LHREKGRNGDPTDDLTFPTFFAHSLRKDWGVGVLGGRAKNGGDGGKPSPLSADDAFAR
jgi:hypothetical protein